jgi:hypothetical protein
LRGRVVLGCQLACAPLSRSFNGREFLSGNFSLLGQAGLLTSRNVGLVFGFRGLLGLLKL